MRSRYRRLALVLTGLTLLVAALAATSILVPGAFLGPFLVGVLVLTLPGFAMFAAIAPRAGVGESDWFLFSLGLSLVAGSLGAVVLNLTPVGVTPVGWLLLLGGLTAAGSISVAWRWRREGRRPSAPRIEPWPALLVAAAAVIVIGAGAVARAGADGDPSSPVTQLWMLPAPADTAELELGVSSSVGGSYRIEVWRGTHMRSAWSDISLSPGEVWRRTIPVPAGRGPVEARLSSSEAPGSELRFVAVTPQRDRESQQP